jgi:hypothetical protein
MSAKPIDAPHTEVATTAWAMIPLDCAASRAATLTSAGVDLGRLAADVLGECVTGLALVIGGVQ